jgi:hypothetical protein
LATGSVAAIVAEAAEKLAPFGDAVRTALGRRGCWSARDRRGVSGRLHWLHTASTPELLLITGHAKWRLEAMDLARVSRLASPATDHAANRPARAHRRQWPNGEREERRVLWVPRWGACAGGLSFGCR